MAINYKRKQQKIRSYFMFKYPILKFGKSSIYAVSSGFLLNKMIKNFAIRLRKIFKSNFSKTKFWIFLTSNYIVTKKAQNVRMGKGKGSRKGLVSIVKSGTTVIEFKHCRLGILLRLWRYVRVRCPFKTFFFNEQRLSCIVKNKYCKGGNIRYKTRKKIRTKRFVWGEIKRAIMKYRQSTNIKRTRILARLLKSYKSRIQIFVHCDFNSNRLDFTWTDIRWYRRYSLIASNFENFPDHDLDYTKWRIYFSWDWLFEKLDLEENIIKDDTFILLIPDFSAYKNIK